jgi:hypothetical protein
LATHRSSLSRHQGVLRLALWCRGVGVLDFDEPAAPARRQGGRGEVDAVDAEPVELLERGEFPGDAFDEVREALGLGVVVGDGKDVDFDGPCRVSRQLVLAESASGWTGSRRRSPRACR